LDCGFDKQANAMARFCRECWRLAGVPLVKLAGGTPALPFCLAKVDKVATVNGE
jgi:hypothetical protein